MNLATGTILSLDIQWYKDRDMKWMLAALSIVLLTSILILGCDGGEEVSGISDNTSFAPENAVILSGVVATHEPVQGIVQAINTRGEATEEIIADGKGRFSFSLPDHPPFLLRMLHRAQGVELFSFAASAGHVNLTPLTHLAMYVAVGTEVELQDLFHDWDGTQLSPEEVQMATATVNANLAPLLHQQGLDPKTYDFFRTDFNSDGTGIDAVLKTVRISIDPTDQTLSRSIRVLDTAGQPLLAFDPAASDAPTTESPDTARKKEDASQ